MIYIADVVGIISDKIQRLLGCTIPGDEKIYLGQSNIAHMKARHWEDYQKYGSCIPEILRLPDYIGRNPADDSIEYVKEFKIDNEYVKVAVRVASSGKYYARSLYVLNHNRVHNFIKKGTLKRVEP